MKSLPAFACLVIRMIAATDPLTAALGPGGLSALGSIGQQGSVAYVPNSMMGVQKAFQAMAFLPLVPAAPTVFIDPNLLSTEDACERDYKAKCPQGFVVVGDVYGDGVRCAANLAKYQGRCKDRPIKFVRLTKRAKQHWSILCGFQWPCRECERDYTDPCPLGWTLDLSDPTLTTLCSAHNYDGPCESKYDFAGLTPAAKLEWSEECSVYWPYFFTIQRQLFLLVWAISIMGIPVDQGMIGAYGPFAKPHNYPFKNGSPPRPAEARQSPDGAPVPPKTVPLPPENPPVHLGYEDTFPVINVRFQYPPSALDNMRRNFLAKRNGDLLTNSRIVNSDMNEYLSQFRVHFARLSKIVGYLEVLPRNLKSKLQNYLLRLLADLHIPEVPAGPLDPPQESLLMNYYLPTLDTKNGSLGSSFLEETNDNIQINIGIEDNLGDFRNGPEIGLNEAEMFVRDISESWHQVRHVVIELIKVKVKQIELIQKYLYPRLFATSKDVSKIRAEQNRAEKKAGFSFLQTNVTDVFFNQTGKADPGRSGPVGSLDVAVVAQLRSRVMQGGRSGALALAGLIDLWDQQFGWRDLIRKSKVQVDCRLLMSIQTTPDYIKNLAGSLLTLITGAPVSSSVPDVASGSYGHVNVIIPRPSRTYLPDKEIALTT